MSTIQKQQKHYLESVFGIKYDPKPIRGDVDVEFVPDTPDEKRDYENRIAEALARQYLIRALNIKKLRDAVWDGLNEQLEDFFVGVDADKYPNLSRALRRLSDGETTDLTWPMIRRAYNIYRNTPTLVLGFDPVAGVFGEIGDNGAYMVDNFGGAQPSNCEEAEDMSYAENSLGRSAGATGNEGDGTEDSQTQEELEAASDQARNNLFWTIIKTLFFVMAELFFTTLADFFNQWRNMPVVKKLIRRIVKSLRRLAAYFRCLYENAGIPGNHHSECWNNAKSRYPNDDDDENDEGDDTDYNEIGDNLASLMKDNISSGTANDCVQAASEVMNFVRSRSTSAVLAAASAPENSNIPDWMTVLAALSTMYADNEFATTSQALLEASDFGADDVVIEGSDITVGEATDELSQDNQRNPLYRVRYYGSTKTRWTQLKP
jgi:hypothetical protein